MHDTRTSLVGVVSPETFWIIADVDQPDHISKKWPEVAQNQGSQGLIASGMLCYR